MKKCFNWIFLGGLSALMAGTPAHCQSYVINKYKVSGSEAVSANAHFSLNGTTAQCDADGPLTNNSYSLAESGCFQFFHP
jgi:hypothetical protein